MLPRIPWPTVTDVTNLGTITMLIMVSFQIVFKASHPVSSYLDVGMVCIPDQGTDSVKYTLHHLNVSARLIFTESWLGVVTEQFYAGSMSIKSDLQRAPK